MTKKKAAPKSPDRLAKTGKTSGVVLSETDLALASGGTRKAGKGPIE